MPNNADLVDSHMAHYPFKDANLMCSKRRNVAVQYAACMRLAPPASTSTLTDVGKGKIISHDHMSNLSKIESTR